MTKLDQILESIIGLDPIEQERLLELVAQRLYPDQIASAKSGQSSGHRQIFDIVKTPNVCGGNARFVRTRIPVWTVERMRQLGVSEIDILRSYPSLKAADLAQAWSYVAAFPDEIESAIRANETD